MYFLNCSLAMCRCSFIVVVNIPSVPNDTGHNLTFFAIYNPLRPYFLACYVI